MQTKFLGFLLDKNRNPSNLSVEVDKSTMDKLEYFMYMMELLQLVNFSLLLAAYKP